MIARAKRMSTPLFKKTMEKGESFNSPLFALKYMRSQGQSRFSVSISKKLLKSAVERNKVRRRAYSAINSLYPAIKPGFHGVLLAKKPVIGATFKEISSVLEALFGKSGLLK